MSLGFRHSTKVVNRLAPAHVPQHLRSQRILTGAIISSALWHFSALENPIGVFRFVFALAMRSRVFMTIRVLVLRWMTAIKVHTLAHTGTTLTWCGHFVTRTHIAHTQRWPQASLLPLASLAALIKLVLGCYYGCIAWHRLMCVTRHTRTPKQPSSHAAKQPRSGACWPTHLTPTCFYAAVALSFEAFESGPHKKGLWRAR